ncbi:lipid-A-disaccharide synthase [Ferrovum sp. PN-J185]|uniref:lipid-A-disaccharide synthase n=1 Tax=Ferrovum sp. PN-J185 TaxID=1356306 RepID=UPI000793DB7E|nr:lipid-A-disaccharide synthase [Ferrovum sp. PN-J185]KXW56316.1 lipid-A-disaccharide synthase [Ferrovum sp. PN-J185]MCC6069040.1 lipid-A-disaccharide synthase [Ferrovum sp. PN-J185]MDE1890980.1 lipid-A-disaccharide synthase [Betaproteobacteria bacterium]MDE2055708.1 lipid-A-disaccharide synthase [Betaproteobacteria bacterium]
MLRVGVVAGEASGDQLGASLIRILKQHYPDIYFEGIAGPLMMKEGAHSLFPMDKLSVRGYWEVLRSLRELLSIRKKIIAHFIHQPPDLFIGIDAPDFNLGVEEQLHARGIKTIQMVAPTVWAWREGRLPLIQRAVDRLLVVFPFEKQYFATHRVTSTYIGHPLVNQLPHPVNRKAVRESLFINDKDHVVALLPGSRSSEIEYHARLFMNVAKEVSKHNKPVTFLIPFINTKLKELFCQLAGDSLNDVHIMMLEENAHRVLSAADVALVASGTATLEAALFDCPQVVTYKLSAFTAWMVRRKKKKGFVALPNLILNQPIIDEWLQEKATVENITASLDELLSNQVKRDIMLSAYQNMRQELSIDTEQAIIDGVRLVLENHAI